MAPPTAPPAPAAPAVSPAVDAGGPVDVEPTYAISEVAERTGVSIDTLRYYERAGLLSVDRDDAGRRRYRARDLGRVIFISRLRAADLPIERLQHYVALAAQGPDTEPERLAILEQHRDEVRQRMANLEAALAMIEYKIDHYGGSLTGCSPWTATNGRAVAS